MPVSPRDLSASSRGLVLKLCERVAKSARVSPRDPSASCRGLVLTRCERVAKSERTLFERLAKFAIGSAYVTCLQADALRLVDI